MRLIDADALLNDAEALCEDVECFLCDLYRPRKQECRVVTWIESAPTIDAVEVVRCKECKWWNDDGVCEKLPVSISEFTYCSWGERRTE